MASSSPFFDLPAELRVLIYEHLFNPKIKSEIDLCRAKPPSSSPLLTCREIYKEAKKIYTQGYRNYWRTNTFRLTKGPYYQNLQHRGIYSHHTILDNFKALNTRNIREITSLKISAIFDMNRTCWQSFTLLDRRGGWLWESGSKETVQESCIWLVKPPTTVRQLANSEPVIEIGRTGVNREEEMRKDLSGLVPLNLDRQARALLKMAVSISPR